RPAVPRRLAATGALTRLPCGKLEETGEENDPADRDGNGAREGRQFHSDRRERHPRRKQGQPEGGPNEEVARAHERGEPAEARLAAPANCFAIAPEHRN